MINSRANFLLIMFLGLIPISVSAFQLSSSNMENAIDGFGFYNNKTKITCLQNINGKFEYKFDNKKLIRVESSINPRFKKENNESLGFLISNDYLKEEHVISKYPDEFFGNHFLNDPIIYYNIESKMAVLNVDLIKAKYQSYEKYKNPLTMTKMEIKYLENVIIYFSSKFGFQRESLILCGDFNIENSYVRESVSREYNINSFDTKTSSHIITFNKTKARVIKEMNLKKDSKLSSSYSIIDFYEPVPNGG